MNIGKVIRDKSTVRPPLWKGPEEDGITFSLLSRFLVCRERFRITMMEGLAPADGFNHKLEFGSMWHECEQTLAESAKTAKLSLPSGFFGRLDAYRDKLFKRYPMSRVDIYRWAETVRVMFPVYVDFWKKHPDVVSRKSIESEKAFSVPYSLGSGRVVRLRGKRDALDLIGGPRGLVFVQENKTKSRIEENSIRRQLTFDLQTMMYILGATWENEHDENGKGLPARLEKVHRYGAEIGGVRYNVVKRPEHRVGAKETVDEFVQRLKGIVEKEPDKFFMRWQCKVSRNDLTRFRNECFDPILENLWDWWEVQNLGDVAAFSEKAKRFNAGFVTPSSWRHPFGVWNILDEGGYSDLDEYLMTGSKVGLRRVDNLFPELS